MEPVTLTSLPYAGGKFTSRKEDAKFMATAIARPRDVMYACEELKAEVDGETLLLTSAKETLRLPFSEPGIVDLASLIGIPSGYVKRCDANLAATNINRWLGDEGNQNRTLRIREKAGCVYGVASEHYIPIDNVDVMEVLQKNIAPLDFELDNWVVGPKRMAVDIMTKIQADVKIGDTVGAGYRVSNSENGYGSLAYQVYFLRLVCTNGAVAPVTFGGRSWKHLGTSGEEMFHDFTEGIREGAKKAEEYLGALTKLVKREVDAAEFIKNLCETDRALPKKMLETLMEAWRADELGEDNSLWGVYNAITRVARDAAKVETRDALQEYAGILAVSPEKYSEN